jgi:hypothetical protein
MEVTLVPVIYRGKQVIAAWLRDLRQYKQIMMKLETAPESAESANKAAGIEIINHL